MKHLGIELTTSGDMTRPHLDLNSLREIAHYYFYKGLFAGAAIFFEHFFFHALEENSKEESCKISLRCLIKYLKSCKISSKEPFWFNYSSIIKKTGKNGRNYHALLNQYTIKHYRRKIFPDQKIVLAMIVKNEEHVIARSINSIKHLVHHWIIADTGSNDHTASKVIQLLSDIPGKLVFQDWKNFAYNRNLVLKEAKKFGDYVLTIDADEELADQTQIMPNLSHESYAFPVFDESKSFLRTVMLRSDSSIEYISVIHEFLYSYKQNHHDRVIEQLAYRSHGDGGRSREFNPVFRDIKLLQEGLRSDSLCRSRYLFYLGGYYQEIGYLWRAISAFRLILNYHSPYHDARTTSYQMALTYLRYGQLLGYFHGSLPERIDCFLKSFQWERTIGIALYEIGLLYKSTCPNSALIFLDYAKELSVPKYAIFISPNLAEEIKMAYREALRFAKPDLELTATYGRT